jgi:hypothetical protein
MLAGSHHASEAHHIVDSLRVKDEVLQCTRAGCCDLTDHGQVLTTLTGRLPCPISSVRSKALVPPNDAEDTIGCDRGMK